MRTRRFKVYAGHLFGGKFGFRGSRVIVAARSWEEVARIVETPVGHLKRFWSYTGNKHELETALGKPLTAFFVADGDQWQANAKFKQWTTG